MNIISNDVRAVVWSLDHEPRDWSASTILEKGPAYLVHKSGLRVWALNRPYGVEIKGRNHLRIWGGVSILSTFLLSPSHWLLSCAIGRWLVRSAPTFNAPARENAASYLRTTRAPLSGSSSASTEGEV